MLEFTKYMTPKIRDYSPLRALSNLGNMHFDGKLCNKESICKSESVFHYVCV